MPALLVAALYMAGGAMWTDRAQFALGAWIALSTVVAAAVGPPGLLLVMSLAGGGGMLVAAAVGGDAARWSATERSVTSEPLDPVIHSQARLRIMTTLTALAEGDRITFPRLQRLLDATAGNLSTHLRRLEEAGYVEVVKGHQGRVPSTHVSATRAGRRAFEDYLEALQAMLTPPTEPATPTKEKR